MLILCNFQFPHYVFDTYTLNSIKYISSSSVFLFVCNFLPTLFFNLLFFQTVIFYLLIIHLTTLLFRGCDQQSSENLYSYPTSFDQVPVLVIFVLKCSLLKNLIYCYIFRSACLFWSKQATNILKTIRILLLVVQYHNAPSNFANSALGETAMDYQGPQPVSE